MNVAKQSDLAQKARKRLIETGGRTAQELGMGRILGQILVYLYLHDGERSLDQIGEDLELSKASVSIAARQLESMGALQRTWKKGDRKNYFKTAENIGTALKHGLFSFLSQKIKTAGMELHKAGEMVEMEAQQKNEDPEIAFVYQRIQRAKLLSDKLTDLLENPLIRASL